MNRDEFVKTLAPQAIEARRDGSPLFPSVRIAQNILETGGKINAHNNLGGFKVGGGKPNAYWKGETYTTPTWEMSGGKRYDTVATWRSYDSVYDFYRDQDALFQNTRYERVRNAKTANEQCDMLQKCGYATDVNYASKLKATMLAYGLSKLDEGVDDYMMNKEDANVIINGYLKPAYAQAKEQSLKVEIGRLADELRLASGQEPQNNLHNTK